MTTNYVGADLFSANLDLITDADAPRAQPVRVPSERLLDNTIHLLNRVSKLKLRVAETADDFTQIIDNSGAGTPHILSDSGVWRVRHTNGAYAAGATAGAFGELAMTRASGSAEAYIGKETAWMIIRKTEIRFIGRPKALGANVKCEIGLTDNADATPGDPATITLSLYYDFSLLGPNWFVRVRAAGTDQYYPTGSAVSAGANQQIAIVPTGSLYRVTVNGIQVASPTESALSLSSVGFPFARFSGAGASDGLIIDSLQFRGQVARW